MCGRFALTTGISELQARFGFVMDGAAVLPRYNIAPTQPVLAVLAGSNGGRRGVMVRWGLMPAWVKDDRVGRGMINAVGETAAVKPAFRGAFRKRRCLVLADGFYEWRRDGQRRTPFYFRRKSGGPMALAGLWECRETPRGERMLSCAIITTAANSVMAPVHHRMPVILSPESEDEWLDPLTESPDVLGPLLMPYPSELLEMREVSPLVNSVRNDGPGGIADVRYSSDAPFREVRLFS